MVTRRVSEAAGGSSPTRQRGGGTILAGASARRRDGSSLRVSEATGGSSLTHRVTNRFIAQEQKATLACRTMLNRGLEFPMTR